MISMSKEQSTSKSSKMKSFFKIQDSVKKKESKNKVLF